MKKLLIATLLAGLMSTSAMAVTNPLKVTQVWVQGSTTYVVGILIVGGNRFKCSVQEGDTDVKKAITAAALTAQSSGVDSQFFADWTSGSCVLTGIIVGAE